MRTKVSLAVVATLMAAACQQGGVVDVDQSGGSTIFIVRKLHGSSKACVDDLSIYAGKPEGEPIWQIAAYSTAPCTMRFRFARTPQGFAADSGGSPTLMPGTHYTVVASGKGFVAHGVFTPAVKVHGPA